MKQIPFFILFFIFTGCNTIAQENIIWGIWNIDNRENSRAITYTDGTFLVSREYLSFDSDYYGNGHRFAEQGQYYNIKK